MSPPGVLCVDCLFWECANRGAVLAGIAALAFGDPAAALVGTRWGQRRYTRWAHGRSVEGSLAFLLVSGIATAAGLLVALVIVAGFGVPGFVPLGIFVLGSGLLTRMGSRRKERTGAAEPNRGRRDERHVAAKLALPALAGSIALFGPGPTPTLALVTTAALAAAFADTAATEAGPLTGGHAYGVRGMRLVALRHGAPGGMSSGGFFAAAAAAILVAFGAWLAKLLDSPLEAGGAAGGGVLPDALEGRLAAAALGAGRGD